MTLESKRENSGTAQLVTSLSVGNSQVRLDPPEDIVVLYQTLVRDQALPAGFEEAFSTLAPHISPAASRQQGRLAMTNNTQAALDVHVWRKRVSDAEKRTEVAQAQFLLAASKPPKKYISKLQKAIYQGPTSKDGRSGKGPVDQAPGRSAPGFTHAHGRDSSSKTGRRVIARCPKKGLHSTLRGRIRASGGSAPTTISPTHSLWSSSWNTSVPDTVNPVTGEVSHEAMVF